MFFNLLFDEKLYPLFHAFHFPLLGGRLTRRPFKFPAMFCVLLRSLQIDKHKICQTIPTQTIGVAALVLVIIVYK